MYTIPFAPAIAVLVIRTQLMYVWYSCGSVNTNNLDHVPGTHGNWAKICEGGKF